MPFEWYQYIDKGTTLVIKSQSVCNAIALSHTELWFIALHCDSYVYQAFFPTSEHDDRGRDCNQSANTTMDYAGMSADAYCQIMEAINLISVGKIPLKRWVSSHWPVLWPGMWADVYLLVWPCPSSHPTDLYRGLHGMSADVRLLVDLDLGPAHRSRLTAVSELFYFTYSQ